MERDFMGLNSKDSAVEVNEDVLEERKESGLTKSLGVTWPLSNKMSNPSQFMSLKSEEDEKPSKEARQNFGGSITVQQFLGGNPLAAPHSVLPSSASVTCTTEQWANFKASSIPTQLTIFYAGTVSVFDGISPEKAQAIMFLAGNACIPSNMAQSKLQVQAPATKLAASDRPLANQSMKVAPSSGIPSPMSVSSHPIDHSANSDDVKVSKTINMPIPIINKVEPQRIVSSLGSVDATAMISAAVPQARKASLARFLEKRKERVMSAAPYNLGKKAADCGTPESNGFGFSATSNVSSNKEISGEI